MGRPGCDAGVARVAMDGHPRQARSHRDVRGAGTARRNGRSSAYAQRGGLPVEWEEASAVDDRMHDPVVLEIDRESRIVPAGDRRLADGRETPLRRPEVVCTI